MKLIDILVEELPKHGGWPEGATRARQSRFDTEIYITNKGNYVDHPNTKFNPGIRASDCQFHEGGVVTREQYEAALAAKNDGWIEWGGGECPIPDDALVEVQFRNRTAFHVAKTSDANLLRWSQDGSDMDIIAYRMSMPSEKYAQFEASQEWNGEGLPPVGCECEVSVDGGRSWCTYRAINEKNGARLIEIGNFTEEFPDNNWIFRPIRSEAERKRGAAKNAIAELCRSSASNGHSADLIYDAIAAGKIPGVKLDD